MRVVRGSYRRLRAGNRGGAQPLRRSATCRSTSDQAVPPAEVRRSARAARIEPLRESRELRVEAERLLFGQLLEPAALLLAEADDRADHLVRLPEGHAALDHQVGQLGREQRVALELLLESTGVDLDPAPDALHDPQRSRGGVDPVEERLLVFLQVAVVGERQPLDHRQERLQVAVDAPCFPAHQLGGVGVALLRHDARAGRVLLVEPHEAELVGRPEHQLLRHP